MKITADLSLPGRPCGYMNSQMFLTAQCVAEALVYAPFQGLWGGDTRLQHTEPRAVEMTLAVMINNAFHSIVTAQGPCTSEWESPERFSAKSWKCQCFQSS